MTCISGSKMPASIASWRTLLNIRSRIIFAALATCGIGCVSLDIAARPTSSINCDSVSLRSIFVRLRNRAVTGAVNRPTSPTGPSNVYSPKAFLSVESEDARSVFRRRLIAVSADVPPGKCAVTDWPVSFTRYCSGVSVSPTRARRTSTLSESCARRIGSDRTIPRKSGMRSMVLKNASRRIVTLSGVTRSAPTPRSISG